MKTVWILVKVYGLIVESVELFFSEEEAIEAWENYTEFNYKQLQEDEEYKEFFHAADYDQTKIFEIDLSPDDIKKALA